MFTQIVCLFMKVIHGRRSPVVLDYDYPCDFSTLFLSSTDTCWSQLSGMASGYQCVQEPEAEEKKRTATVSWSGDNGDEKHLHDDECRWRVLAPIWQDIFN